MVKNGYNVRKSIAYNAKKYIIKTAHTNTRTGKEYHTNESKSSFFEHLTFNLSLTLSPANVFSGGNGIQAVFGRRLVCCTAAD